MILILGYINEMYLIDLRGGLGSRMAKHISYSVLQTNVFIYQDKGKMHFLC